MAFDLIDTHCHVHEIEAALTNVHDKWFSDGVERTAETIIFAAHKAGVNRMIVIGTTLADSELAVRFAQEHDNVWASIGIHPHEAKDHRTDEQKARFSALASEQKVVAVGECGLDYFYDFSPHDAQKELLRFQIELALKHNLPLSFHVRDAYDDFWPIFESYQGVRGVLHSFTDSQANMEHAIDLGLYIGVNGIATFASSAAQHVIYRTIPQHRILLETDAPFLTPTPFRGKVCEPKHVANTAEFLAQLRGESLQELTAATTANAEALFGLK
jgi:TatD DNase family protein